jgi:hypothetical protein
MRILPALAALALFAAPISVRAQDNPVVLELFTSQGCSACPPADALLAELAGQDGVIALALHVDYWDYLGWADSFADPKFTARQRAYAKKAKSRSIYTPQMIVQGKDRLIGNDAEMILERIAAHGETRKLAAVELERDGETLVIRLKPVEPDVGPAEVHVVRYVPSEAVSIEGGENAGQLITYANIVTDWDTAGIWDGTTPVELRFEGLDDRPGAVIVQRQRMGPVLAAAALP